LLQHGHAGETVAYGDQRIEFNATPAFSQTPLPTVDKVTVADREQSNTTVLVDSNCVVKLLRRVNEGIHPEIEIGRFLVEAGFKNAPDLLAWADLVEGDARSAIAVVHRFVENQGDAWTVTGGYLDRFIDEQRVLSTDPPDKSPELASYLQRMRLIGRRTGELENALASRDDLPDFAPEPITSQDVTAWTERMLERSKRTFDLLAQRRTALSEGYRELAGRLLDAGDRIAAHARQLLPEQIDAFKIRHHGDFHLGQILMAKDDVYILDFEGEPQRSLPDRRRKAAAARDVAGLIRSIDYSTISALTRANNLTAEERTLLDPKLEIWREQSIEAFWSACREVSDARLWPSDPMRARHLLDFFLLEKALYELEYELMNRPAWLHVPLEGMWRILSRHGVVQQ
jgi:maltose alpha-D-glucosyltransferase/alpha-amylase